MLRLNFNVMLKIEFVILNVRLCKRFMYIYIYILITFMKFWNF